MSLTIDGFDDLSGAAARARPDESARRAARRRSPLPTSFVVVYAMLAAMLLLAPRPVLEQLQAAEPNAVVDLGKRALTRVSAISTSIGAQPAFDHARDLFLNGSFPPDADYQLRLAHED